MIRKPFKYLDILTEEKLTKFYCKDNYSLNRLSSFLGINRTTIREYLIKFGIKIRKSNKWTQESKLKKCGKGNSMFGVRPHNYCGGLPRCIDCNKQLTAYDYKRCGSCSRKGKFNPNYIDGRSYLLYPEQFNEELRECIKLRDNYECQNCFINQEEHLIVFGRDLDVHHIDYNKKNCSKENLITLCRSCNVRANYNRNYWHDFYKSL